MPISRRRFVAAVALLPLTGCAGDGTIARFETSGATASPGGRGLARPVLVSYVLNRPATVAAGVRGPDGREWPLRGPAPRNPGEEYQLAFDGTVPLGSGPDRQVLGDGSYELRLTAVEPDGRRDERRASIAVTGSDAGPLELDGPSLSIGLITPDGDGVDDEVRIAFTLSKQATVDLAAEDATGDRAAILAPTLRPPGRQEVLWDGSSGGRVFGGKRMPDGAYTLTLTARDDAGNVRVRQAPLRIANGGIERLEIADASLDPRELRLGDQLRVRIAVRNTGETTIRTMGPPAGTPYRASQSYNTLVGPDGRPLEPISGAWRVGIGWQGEAQELPLRWGLLGDPSGTIAPGGRAVVEATVTIDDLFQASLPDVRFWFGAIREGVGMTSGRVGDRIVRVLPGR